MCHLKKIQKFSPQGPSKDFPPGSALALDVPGRSITVNSTDVGLIDIGLEN